MRITRGSWCLILLCDVSDQTCCVAYALIRYCIWTSCHKLRWLPISELMVCSNCANACSLCLAAANFSDYFPSNCWILVGFLGCTQACNHGWWIYWWWCISICHLVNSYYFLCLDPSGFLILHTINVSWSTPISKSIFMSCKMFMDFFFRAL